jgi:hypothetical protein
LFLKNGPAEKPGHFIVRPAARRGPVGGRRLKSKATKPELRSQSVGGSSA